MAFDPDKYLSGSSGGFDPDAYLGVKPKAETPELSAYDKYVKPLTPEGDLRGSVYGRVMQGMADPGVALVQLAANAVGGGRDVNQRIAEVEKQYQASRQAQGSTGFDPLRMAGNVAITAPLAGSGSAATLAGRVGQGAFQGAGFGALQPVTNGGESFWTDKAKESAIGAAAGGVMAPIAGAAARIISPNASKNAEVQLLKSEGVNPTIGQTLGGWANRLEEKMQSLPILGDAITSARKGSEEQLRKAAYARALDPIGGSTNKTGREVVNDIANQLGDSYEKLIPKLSVDVTDPTFVSKIASLRQGVQNLPPDLQKYFDGLLSREIDGRVAPNGVLSGQNLKDAWNALRDAGKKLSNSPDAFQADLGGAIKQTFQELKDHVSSSNPKVLVDALKKTDLGYANYKRIERAASGLGADMGNFSAAQLQNAVSAMNGFANKGQFAKGKALMQDLTDAGKSVLSTKYPDSGTVGRGLAAAAAVGSGTISPAIPLALGAGAAAYIPAVQRMLSGAVSSRPIAAASLGDLVREMYPQLAAASAPAAVQASR